MMSDHRFWSLERAGGFFLLLGFVANFGGVLMFSLRHGTAGGPPPNQPYFVWERSFFLAAVVLTAIGFVLLEGYLRNTNGSVLARTGATAYLFGGILGVAAEALTLSAGFDQLHVLALINIYVVLAFLAQAAIGGALLQSGLLAAWIGWVTILWNLGCLVVLPVITPHDIYFPIFHHLIPLLIGSALLWRSRSHNSR